jgi:hypothetical protein
MQARSPPNLGLQIFQVSLSNPQISEECRGWRGTLFAKRNMWYEIINPVAPSSLNPIRAGWKSTWPVSKGPGLVTGDTHDAAFYRDKDANHEKNHPA